MSIISGIGNSLYNLFIKDPVTVWTNKSESEEIGAGDVAKAYAIGMTSPIWAPLALLSGCAAEEIPEVDDACPNNQPQVGALSIDPATLEGELVVYGAPTTFLLPIDAECYGDPANLTVTLYLNTESHEMRDEDGDGIFSATLPGASWNPPMYALVTDENGLEIRREIWNSYGVKYTDDCAYSEDPTVQPGSQIKVEPSATLLEGETATFSFRMENAIACDGTTGLDSSQMRAHFIMDGEEFPEAANDGEYYFQSITFPEARSYPYKVSLKIVDEAHPGGDPYITDEIEVYVQPAGSTATPSAVIGSELEYAYHLGDTAENITCYSDDAEATFEWVVTRPEEDEFGDIIQYFDGPTIASYTFDALGDFDFKCIVTAGDGETTNQEIRSVGVYEADVELPQAGIYAPVVAHSGDEVTFVALGADETEFTYTWDFNDETGDTGAIVNKTYTLPPDIMATYTVKLTVARIDDPTVKDVTTQKITIIPIDVDAPEYDLDIPFAEEEDVAIPMSITLADPDNWDISWRYGDGTAIDSGVGLTDVIHTYTDPGKKNIIVTLTSELNPTFEVEIPFTITVTPHGDPVPSLDITPSTAGPVPFAVTFDATNSYATADNLDPDDITSYTINYGDGSTPETNTTGIFNKTYFVAGSKTVSLTVEDDNGHTSTITSVVTPY